MEENSTMKKKLLLLFTLIQLLMCVACESKTDTISPNNASQKQDKMTENGEYIIMDFESVVEVQRYLNSYPGTELDILHVKFSVPLEFTEEQAKNHTLAFIKNEKTEYPALMTVVLSYYDDEVYAKYYDFPMIEICWKPSSGRYSDVPVGDYSTHVIFSVDRSIYNEEYELTEQERALYDALQSRSVEVTGKPIIPFYDTTFHPSGELSVYEHVAAENGVTVEELMTIRVKATMRMEPELFTDTDLG